MADLLIIIIESFVETIIFRKIRKIQKLARPAVLQKLPFLTEILHFSALKDGDLASISPRERDTRVWREVTSRENSREINELVATS